MDELLEQFLIETPELIQQASDATMTLLDGPDAAAIDQAFRAVHTLKGSVALFRMEPLLQVLHAAEDMLGGIRSGAHAPASDKLDVLLRLLNDMESWLPEMAASDGELPASAGDACRRLVEDLRSGTASAPARATESGTGWAHALLAERSIDLTHGETVLALRYAPDADCFFRGEDPLGLIRSVPDLLAVDIRPDADIALDEGFDPFRCHLVIQALTRARRSEVEPLFSSVGDQVWFAELSGGRSQADARQPAGSDIAGAALRVDAERVDRLMDIVSELVVAKNSLGHLAALVDQDLPKQVLHRRIQASKLSLDRLVGDLHQAVVRVRMVPLRRALQRLPRLVRETAARLSKDVAFSMRGGEIEADKALVDGLFEPLLHLLRNAIDHGVETAEARAAAGKPPQGIVTLHCARAGDLLTVSIADDGRGMDPSALRQAAKAKRLMTEGAIDAMSDSEALNLVFTAGFSTMREVSDISGRGVGMDAVRHAVEQLGGRVTLESRVGAGTNVDLTLPLSAVLSRILTVNVAGETYGVMMDDVRETVRVPVAGVIPIGTGEAFVLRDRTVSLLRLKRLLGMMEDATIAEDHKVLIFDTAGDRIGIAVDALGERLDVIIRPVGAFLSALPGISGTTLRGDGSVLMILDPLELAP